MRHIDRNPAPQEFVDLVNGDNRPCNWDAFRSNYHDLYRQIRDLIWADQKGVSGYTELPLDKDNGIHIDHFRKKGMFHDEEFHWENFVVDERNNDQYGAGHKDKVVKTAEIYDDLLGPVLDRPEEYFTYMEDGTIIPRRTIEEKMQKRAQVTRDAFNLNHEYLKNRRNGLIALFRSYRKGGMSKDDVYATLATAGFFSLIDYVYEE